jgi:hypothetical protein
MDGANGTEATSWLQLVIFSFNKQGSFSGKHSFRFGQLFMKSFWRHEKAPVTFLQSHTSHPCIFSNFKIFKDANGRIAEEELLPFP